MKTIDVSVHHITWRDVLREPNMKWFIPTQAISLIGLFLRAALIGLLIPQIVGGEDKAAVPVTIAAALNTLPGIFLSIFAGMTLDKFNKRLVLSTTTMAGICQLLLLARVSQGDIHLIALWKVHVLALFGGIIGVIDSVGRSAIISELLHDKKKIAVAGTVFSCLYTGGMILGTSLAGYLTAWKGFPFSFVTTAVISSVLLIGLWQMNYSHVESNNLIDPRRIRERARDGIVFALSNNAVRICIAIPLVVVMLGYTYQFILPIVKKTMLNGGLKEFGKLGAAAGCGSFIGSVTAVIWSVRYPLRVMIIGIVVLGIGEIWFSQCTTIPFGQMSLFLCGFGLMSAASPFRGLMLRATPSTKQGVVVGVSFTCSYLVMTIGALITGQVAKHWGGPIVFMTCGTLLLMFGALLPNLQSVRRLHLH